MSIRIAVSAVAICAGAAQADLVISELSTKSAYNPEDYFEITNTGSVAVDISGWAFDDESADYGSAAFLENITMIGAGESVVFFQQDSSDPFADADLFRSFWGGLGGVQVGWYDGAGLGKGDAITIFDADGNIALSLEYGMTEPNQTHAGDWAAGNFDGSDIHENEAAVWVPGSDGEYVLAGAGVYGSFQNTAGEWGSPGVIPAPGVLAMFGLAGLAARRRRG